MPVKLGTFLTNLAQKFGGVDTTSPEFIELLSANLDIPDGIAGSFMNANILTEESARNNPKLKTHFTALALNGGDARITAAMDELAFSEDARSEILSAQSTFDRIGLLARKAAEIGKQKVDATGKEKESLTTQYNALQQQIATLKQDYEGKLTAKDTEFTSKITDYILRNKMSTRKLDTTRFDGETMSTIAFNFLTKALQEKGIKIKNENDVLKLKQAQEESLDYYFNNQPYTIDMLIDEVLANNKLLAVTDPNTPPPGNNGFQQNYTPPANGAQQPGQPKPLNGMISTLDKALADYNMGSGAVV